MFLEDIVILLELRAVFGIKPLYQDKRQVGDTLFLTSQLAPNGHRRS
jgi:hypothetical protein